MAIQKVELSSALNSLATQSSIDKVTGMLGSSAANISKTDLATVVAEMMGNKGLFPFMRRGQVNDCNTIRRAGLYYIQNSALNSPFPGLYGELIVTDHFSDSSWIIQIAIQTRGANLYFRSTGGTFDDVPWYELKGTKVEL